MIKNRFSGSGRQELKKTRQALVELRLCYREYVKSSIQSWLVQRLNAVVNIMSSTKNAKKRAYIFWALQSFRT